MTLEILKILILVIGWPILIFGSTILIIKCFQFYRDVKKNIIGGLVLVMAGGWIVTMYLLGIASTALLLINIAQALFILPIFLIWLIAMVLFMRIVFRWSEEARSLVDFEEIKLEYKKSEFISLASHQLRTPSTAIKYYLEMLLGGEWGEISKEQKYTLEIIQGINRNMLELVAGLLNVSRIELGNFIIKPELLSVAQISHKIIEETKPDILSKKIKIKEEYDPDLPLVKADPRLIIIILQNLITNAARYTPEGGLITVSIYKKDKDIIIQVSDTGYGIPKDQQEKIFTKMFRADNIRKAVPEGTGLGLYFVKSITDQVGGKVWFESEENKGTTFYVAISLAGMQEKIGSTLLS